MTSGSGNPYYFHTNVQGSITALTDNTGAQQWAYSYEPYGLVKSSTKVVSTAPVNPRGWLGELTDTGTGQTHLRARQYDPATGRFTSLDAGGTGAGYQYASANPLTSVDPLGLWGLPSIHSVISGVHRVASDVSTVATVAAVICGATIVCAPAEGIIGPIAGVAGAVSAGTGAILAVQRCSSGKSSCGGDLLTAGLGAVPGLRAASTAGKAAKDAEETVSIFKASQRGLGEQHHVHGYDGKDFPGNGAYFAREKEIADSYAVHYGEGVIETKVPASVYREHFAQHEMPYLGTPPGTELAIPPDKLALLNQYERTWHR